MLFLREREPLRDEFCAGRVTIAVVPGAAGHALLPEQPVALAEVLLAQLKALG